MTTDPIPAHFRSFETELTNGGISQALAFMADYLRQSRRYHELFEALKMQLRERIGLPLLYSDVGEDLPPDERNALEEGLIEACREVGTLLFRAGHIRDGWTYLRPVGEKCQARRMLDEMPITDENVDQIIEVCLHESIDLEKGFRLVLERYGTCNAITTFETAMYGRHRADRAIGAKLLVSHVYHELKDNVTAHIARVEPNGLPATSSLRALIADREWLTADGSYHMDATHLAATMRIARDLSDHVALEQAIELAEYGQRLAPALQYPGDGPFAETYPAHLLYFHALCGRDIERALDYFRQRAEACVPHEETTFAIEVYIDFLHRLGRTRDAIDTLTTMIPDGIRATGFAPSLLELCAAIDDFTAAERICLERGDFLGFAMAKMKAAPR